MGTNRTILKLTLGRQEGDQLGSLVAMMTDSTGAIVGFWDVTEPWVTKQFEGATEAYFEAEIGDDISLIRPVPDPVWPKMMLP